MHIEIQDRKKEIEYARMALNMVEIGVNYTQTDLIIRVLKELDKLNGDLSVKDVGEIFHQWKTEWEKYFDKQNKTE